MSWMRWTICTYYIMQWVWKEIGRRNSWAGGCEGEADWKSACLIRQIVEINGPRYYRFFAFKQAGSKLPISSKS